MLRGARICGGPPNIPTATTVGDGSSHAVAFLRIAVRVAGLRPRPSPSLRPEGANTNVWCPPVCLVHNYHYNLHRTANSIVLQASSLSCMANNGSFSRSLRAIAKTGNKKYDGYFRRLGSYSRGITDAVNHGGPRGCRPNSSWRRGPQFPQETIPFSDG